MLEKVDLSAKLNKEQFKELTKHWAISFGEYQRELKNRRIPSIIVIEGWEMSGKGTLLNQLLLHLDPRSYWVHNITKPTREEKLRPYLWTFWNKLPPYGDIAFFNHSWYWPIILKALKDEWSLKKVSAEIEELKTFERHLIDDGHLLIKIFLHISKDEQKKRFKKLSKDPAFEWRTTQKYKALLAQYDELYKFFDHILEQTSTSEAPWHTISATDEHYAIAITGNLIQEQFEQTLRKGITPKNYLLAPRTTEPLKNVDLSKSLTREHYGILLPKLQSKLRRLQYLCYKQRLPVVIVFEGWDAGGKGGAIKRLVQELDPRGYEVVPIGPPQGDEKNHHHLWRFWRALPKAGHFTIYDRSWYGRVLVERVEGFAKPEEWMRAYSEINEFELQLAKWGAILFKFWMHISPDEQLKRFEERQNNPFKRWKITDEDWRNRAKWNEYEDAVADMIDRTSTVYAPWYIIEGNDKLYARIKVLKTVIEGLEKRLEK